MINSIWIVLAVGIWFFFGYRIYGRFIEKRLKISDKNKTPALTKRDNVDFSPSSKPFLIGHHFASIAGAGPIIGPILAISYFGWLPVVLWVSLGSVFIGAMHDFTSLIASVRNKAQGVSSIAKKSLNSKSGILFGVMILITLILIITVFSVSAAESIINKPDLIIPLVTITLVALVLGLGVEKFKWNYKISSAVAILVIFASVWLGVMNPVTFAMNEILLKNILITTILFYAGIASIAPVWILLRPRDYLSAIQMSLILLLGLLAILIVHPVINAPKYIPGPIFPIWPILFITVACGAISGFHGIVSSGTTSKQLAKESHGKSVGYGSMIGEATLAILVTIVAIAGLKWGSNIAGGFQSELGKGWIVLFSSGYGNIVGSLGIPLITISLASLLGAFMVNQFILTSVDTSTRLSRFIISENLIPKLKKNKIFVTLLILIPSWFLAVTNSYEILWKLFGTSNQLTAAITMIAISSFFISRKINVNFIVIPALFVLVTTMSALVYLTFRAEGYFMMGNYVLAVISTGMFLLGIMVSWEGFRKIMKS
ncbi:carbon starvation protein A [Candidatus Pacearchaeota archaeon CG10_big_fil_rev_8_21_14_0_10_34_12]|nr:MAG: carbon starvation protein A [Candidatus Pacearchaeota archaeon CG10_big_fil_rev_8_21_14_0_10_34_12]